MCSVYVPNSGEKEALKSILAEQAIILGLYKNQVVPDGNTTFELLEEMTSDGGSTYGYQAKALVNQIIESVAPIADKWALTMNAQGQAQATYSNTPQLWTFLAPDVLQGFTVYGVFGYTIVLPFDAGLTAFTANCVIGATVTGNGGATGVVTGFHLSGGVLGSSTGTGWVYLKTRNATKFIDNEALKVGTTPIATVNITGFDDALKKLVFIEPLTTPTVITQLGQAIGYTPILAMSSL
jgi:hypothetical protein